MSLFADLAQLVSFFPRRAIGPFSAKVTLEEISTDDLEITQHPVQQGAAITDHAYVKPASLTIRAMFDDSRRPLRETYAAMLALQSSREPFDIVTGKRVYENMLFKSLSVTTDVTTENVLSFSADFVEVFLTSLQVVSVPPRSQQAEPGVTGATENAGEKAAVEESNPARQESAASALLGGFL